MDGRFDIELMKRQMAKPVHPIVINIQLDNDRPRLKDLYKKYIKDDSNIEDMLQQKVFMSYPRLTLNDFDIQCL